MNKKVFFGFMLCVLSEAQGVPRDTTHFREMRYAGPGCPPGSASTGLYRLRDSEPPAEFAVYFSSLQASLGPGVSAGLRKKECRVALHFESPKNRQFAILKSQFFGYANLSVGTFGKQGAEYGFPSGNSRVRFETLLVGEFQDDFERVDHFQGGALWSPCGKSVPFFMVMNAEVGGDSSQNAFLTADQATGLLEYRFGLLWRDCVPE